MEKFKFNSENIIKSTSSDNDRGADDINKSSQFEQIKRTELRRLLPSDLQLEFVQNRPDREKWNFEGKLMQRRNSEINEDVLFFEAVKAIDNQDINQLDFLKKQSKEVKEKNALNFNILIETKELMQHYFTKNDGSMAGRLALALRDTESAKKAIKMCFEKKEPDKAGKIALALGDTESARKAMEESYKRESHWLRSALDLAIALGDVEFVKKVTEKCLETKTQYRGYYLETASSAAVFLAPIDPKYVLKILEYLPTDSLHGDKVDVLTALAPNNPEFVERWIRKGNLDEQYHLDYAAQIVGSIVLQKPKLAKDILNKCAKYSSAHTDGCTVRLARKLAPHDPESAESAMKELKKRSYWGNSVGHIAEALAKIRPESSIETMNELFDKNNPHSAGEVAVALGDVASAKRAIQECLNKEDFESAGKIALSIGDVETATLAMQRGHNIDELALQLADKNPQASFKVMLNYPHNKEWDAFRLAEALATSIKLTPDLERLDEITDRIAPGYYGKKIIATLLEQKKDLGLFTKEYYPQYMFLKKFANETNNNIDESKKWEDPEEFFNNNAKNIVNLQLIDTNLSTQLLKNQLSRGLSFTQANLDIYNPVLNNPDTMACVKEVITHYKNPNGQNLSDVLESASAYNSLGLLKEFKEIAINKKIDDFKTLNAELNSFLLKNVAKNLDIKTVVSDQDVAQWKIKYFTNLITNQELIKEKEDEDSLKLYQGILKSVFENKFDDYISNVNQKDELGKKIAKHNKKVENIFKKNSINWDNWLKYKEQVIMSVGTKQKQNRESLFNQFEQRFKEWQEQVNLSEPRLKASLEKDLVKLNQKRNNFDPSKIDVSNEQWSEQLLPIYSKSLSYLRNNNPEFKLSPGADESFDHLVETIKSLSTQQEKERTSKKNFIVKLWDRDPRRDMFQGNQTHCCIAVGVKETPPGGGLTTYHPETIFQYLIDKGVNVAEIVDPDTNDVIAQTWLFVTLDKDKKPILVADNFEVNNRYPAGNNVNSGIRESMFEFLKRYSQASNISRVVLGKVGTNDVEDEDLKILNLPPIDKLGGYFQDDEYYLETLEDTEAREI